MDVIAVEGNPQAAPSPEKSSLSGTMEIPLSGGAVDFERLYQMHGRRVYRLCWNMVWDKDDAEDLTQEVFIQLIRKIHTFRGEAAFTTWLHRLVVNVVLMGRRKKARIEPSLGEGAERGEAPEDAWEELHAPDTRLTGMIDRLDLQHALAQLPAGYRTAFILHDVQGYGHGEIAQMLGLAPGTTKSQLHKARRRLRNLLRGAGSQRPQAKAGRLLRNAGPGALTRRRVTKGLPFVVTPDSDSLQETITSGEDEVHPQGPGEHGTALGNDEFECGEVTYGKTQCA